MYILIAKILAKVDLIVARNNLTKQIKIKAISNLKMLIIVKFL